MIDEISIEKKQTETEKTKKDPDKGTVLAGTSYWRRRLKFEGPLCLIYLGFTAAIILSSVYIWGFEYYFITTQTQWADIINLIVFYVFLLLSTRIRNSFKKLEILDVNNERANPFQPRLDETTGKIIASKERVYVEFKGLITDAFSSKLELLAPISAGLFFLLSAVIGGFVLFASELEGLKLIVYMVVALCIGSVSIMLLIVSALSGILTMMASYRCLNKIGTKEYPINDDYNSLRSGKYEEIGKYIISFTIPIILLGTFISIVGLFYIFATAEDFAGFIYVVMGLLIAVFMSFLLYKNTVNLHRAISDGKQDLKERVISEMHEINERQYPVDQYDKKYKTLVNMQSFYVSIDEINDWPFNPTSIKKLVITLGSSAVPLVLSLFGFV